MDLDRFIARGQPTWSRLEHLTARAGRSPASLRAEELAELVRLYRTTAGHLSHARTRLGDPGLVARLTTLVARSGAVVYGTRPRSVRAVGRFFADTFPAALWTARWAILASSLLFVVPAFASGWWFARTPDALDALLPPSLQEAYVAEDFVDYYRETPAAQFFAEVGLNNIQVGFLAFAGGILLCVPTALVLVFNAVNVGGAGGLFAFYGQAGTFWTFLLPHGLLELTAVFVAGGAGLRLGWAIISPGDRPRQEAVGEEGRRAVVLVLGLVAVFGTAAVIEAFVTGSDLPPWLRIGIGVLAELAFLVYAGVRGRGAVRRGVTGALGDEGIPTWEDVDPGAGTRAAQSRPVALTAR